MPSVTRGSNDLSYGFDLIRNFGKIVEIKRHASTR